MPIGSANTVPLGVFEVLAILHPAQTGILFSSLSDHIAMASLTRISLGIAVLIVVFIQLPIVQRTVHLVRLGLAIGKTIQPISDFAHMYKCRRIEDPRLEACEDMWLSEATRKLFLACSDPEARGQWMPKYANDLQKITLAS